MRVIEATGPVAKCSTPVAKHSTRPKPAAQRRFVIAGVVCMLATVVTTLPRAGHANGRYPTARYLIAGPGDSLAVIALQATFGVLWTDDGGRAWHYACEESLGLTGTWDPSLLVAPDRALLVGLPDGVTRAAHPYCTFERPASAPGVDTVDLAADPSGLHVVAAYAPLGMPNGVWLSDDGGRSWREGWTRGDWFIETVDVAPSRLQRIYASGFLRGAIPVVMRSDDGGRSFVEGARAFGGGYNAYLVGVDATNPDVVFVRSDTIAGGTLLLRSDDGGATFRELTRTLRPMLGATIARADGTLYVGSDDPAEPIQRSRDGGRTWEPLRPGFGVLCLREHAGVLFACADENRHGFALAASLDRGETFRPLHSFSDVRGIEPCTADSGVATRCVGAFETLRTTWTTNFEGGTRPGRTPLDVALPDASVGDSGLDAAAPMDANGADTVGADSGPAPARCACRAPGAQSPRRPRTNPTIGLALTAALWCAALRRRRARQRNGATRCAGQTRMRSPGAGILIDGKPSASSNPRSIC